MLFRLQTMKQTLLQPLFVCLLPLVVLFFLLVVSVPDSAADDPIATIALTKTDFELAFPYGKEGTVPVEVTLSVPQQQDITLIYDVTSTDATQDDIEPFGKGQQLVIPSSESTGKIILTIKSNPKWKIGTTKTAKIELKEVKPNSVGIGESRIATIRITRNQPTVFLPSIQYRDWERGWVQLDPVIKKENRSLALCPHDSSIIYLGTDVGLFRWQNDDPKQWIQVQNVPGSVREIAFGEDCSHVYAAVLNSGVWGTTDSTSWNPIGGLADERKSSRTVIVRGTHLYTGTDTGIYYYDLSPISNGSWTQVTTLNNKVIARLTLAEGRIFAAVWQEGVSYNDSCNTTTCEWSNIIPGPENDKFIRDVIGLPPDPGKNPPGWLLLATSSTVYWWDTNATNPWLSPIANQAPQPTGNVFSLAVDRNYYYAGIENGGVWVTEDGGQSWIRVGNPNDPIHSETIRDIAVPEDGVLYVVTPNNGVWLWPLP